MRAAPMMLATALVTAVVAAAVGSSARRPSRPTVRPAAAGPSALAVARRAHTLVDVSPAQLGYRLVVAGARPGVRAEVDRATRAITLFVGPGQVAHRVAHDLGHELGHAFDDRRMSPALRTAYLRRLGAPDARWWPDGRQSDYGTGAGDFAEVFALCHAASPEFRGRLAARPARPCALLPAGARVGKLITGDRS